MKNDEIYEVFNEIYNIIADRIKNAPQNYINKHKEDYQNGDDFVKMVIENHLKEIDLVCVKQLKKIKELKEIFNLYILED